MPVNLNLHVDCTDVVKHVALPLATRFQSQRRYERKRKLIAMAKECVARLKIAKWNVVVWPPENVTAGLAEALAASKECSSERQRRKIAWELSGAEHTPSDVQRYVIKYLAVDELVKMYGIFKIDGDVDACDACREILTSLASGISSEATFNAIKNHESVVARRGTLVPLWSFIDKPQTSFPDWSSSFAQIYQEEWNVVLDELRLVNDISADSFAPSEGWLRYAIDVVDIYATARLAHLQGIEILVDSSSTLHGNVFFQLWGQPDKYLQFKPGEGKSRNFFVGYMVASHYLSHILMSEYVKFICKRLEQRSNVGKQTNFVRLRNKHIFSSRSVDSDRSMFIEFTFSFSELKAGIKLCVPDKNENENIDCLGLIFDVLAGRIVECSNIQVSLLHQVLRTNVVERKDFLGKIERRHVRMLKCGSDHALVVPYLNMVLLKLNDNRWVRDLNAQALQPLKCSTNGGAIRRVANILIGFEYPTEGEPYVNETAFRLLKTFAEKGELYSKELRKRLLAQVRMTGRVRIDALTITAEEVLGEKFAVDVKVLVREMIHDRLLMRSDNGSERVENEIDAYYDAVYLRRGCSTLNNVEWKQGVPIGGLRIKQHNATGNYVETMGGESGRGMLVFFRDSQDEELVLWRSGKRTGDLHNPDIFIVNSSESETDSTYLRAATESVVSTGYIGSYCPCSIDVGHRLGS